MQRSRLRFSMLVLLFSVLSAYFCAGAFIIALQLSLPRADLAYGQSLGQAFSDPFVLTIASTGALVAGLVAFPVALVCLWNRDVLRCGVVVVGLTSVFLAVGTVLAPPLGLVGAPAIALAALLFCKFTRLPYFRHHEDSASVA